MRELRFTPSEAAALVRNVSGRRAERARPSRSPRTHRAGWPADCTSRHSPFAITPPRAPSSASSLGDNRPTSWTSSPRRCSAANLREIRQFLARTSILGRFCAPRLAMPSANFGQRSGDHRRPRAGELFVVPLDDNRHWYRYHHLFAQVLRGQLARIEPDIGPILYERASAWHRRSGSKDEAIRYALAAGDVAGAVDLIARHWFAYVDSGRAATVRRWMRSLGDDQIAARPLAAHSAMWAAAFSGDRDRVRRWIHVVGAGKHEGPLPDGMPSLDFSAALLRGAFARFDGILATCESRQPGPGRLERDPMSPWYALALSVFGFSLYLSGDPGAAEPLNRAITSEASVPLVQMMALSGASLVATDGEGRLAQAKVLASAAWHVADSGDLSQTPQRFSRAHSHRRGSCAGGTARGKCSRRVAACAPVAGAMVRAAARGPPWKPCSGSRRSGDMGAPRPGAVALLDEARDILTSLPDGAGAQLARLKRLERRIVTRRPQVDFRLRIR